MITSGRFMNQRSEPHYVQEAVPTFRLLFPAWGIGLSEKQREEAKSTWNKNDILIDGHDELLTVVSFIIADDSVTIRKKEGSYTSYPIGVLPLRPGRTLWVIAGWEPEGDLKIRAEDALRKIDASKFVTDEDRGNILSICLTGNSSPDSIFMVVVPVKVNA